MSSTAVTSAAAVSAPEGVLPPARVFAAVLAWLAAAIHLVLTPSHFDERLIYGVFFLVASALQLALGWLLIARPHPRVVRAGALGSMALIFTWTVTRSIAPPLSPEGRPEPVTLLGVLATGAELATLVLLASLFPFPSAARRRTRFAWGLAAGVAFAALVLLSSNAVSLLPRSGYGMFSFDVYWGNRVSLSTPLFYGALVRRIWIVGSWSTFVLTIVAAVFVGLNTAAAARPRACSTDARAGRGGLVAMAPALLTVSGCCGAPIALFLGTGAVVALYRATPWILLATVAGLWANLALVRQPSLLIRTPAASSMLT